MDSDELIKFVTVRIGHQEFGILVDHVIDIILPQKAFPVPLASKEIIGSINLRGKIVTVLDIKLLLDIEDAKSEDKLGKCLISEYNNQLFGFVVDQVAEVNSFAQNDLIKNMDNFSSLWQEISLGIYSKEDSLVVILDIHKAIEYVVLRSKGNR